MSPTLDLKATSEKDLMTTNLNNTEAEWKVRSILPVYKLEYSDGTNWFEVATENFVNVVAKAACVVATIGTSLNATYANGTAGVGATLTNAGTQAVFALDGVTPSVGQRILVKDQTTTLQNGIYSLTNAGSASTNWVLTRTTDYDSPYLINPGDTLVIAAGTINGITSWTQTATMTTVGTSPITFAALAKIGVASVTGTTNQIAVTGTTSAPIVGLATNPTVPGTGSIVVPGGTAAQRVAAAGALRFWNGA
jgi:hypothetical protein